MMLHRHFENDVPKNVTKMSDVTLKTPDTQAKFKPETTQTAKKPGRPRKN